MSTPTSRYFKLGAFVLDAREVFASASIGIALAPDDGRDADTLVRNADTAMYCAKEQGKNNYQFYVPAMNARGLQQLELESSLRRVLDRQELFLHYQPQVDIGSRAVVGTEAVYDRD